MASYDASINVRVTGTGMVDGVLNRVQELERLVKDINTRPINLSKVAGRGELADRFGKAAKELNGLKNSFINSERAVEAFGTTTNRTIANTTALASTFKRIADNSDIATNQFREFTVAAQQAAVAANTLGRTRLATLAEELSFGGAGGKTIGGGALVKELLQQEATIPNSIAALNAYQAELNDLRQLVDVTSNEFRQLDLAMSRIQGRMDLAEGRGPVQGPARPPRGSGAAGGMPAASGPTSSINPLTRRAAAAENLMLGAGFPLLFGGGAGQVAGGLLGSFVGTGFGGQILGSAIGQILEDSLRRVTELGNAAKTVDVPKLKESTIFVNQRLTTTLEQLKKAGELDKARSIIQQEVFKQTGLIPEFLTKSTDSVNLLNNVWQKFIGALSGSVSILGSAFIPLITAVVSSAAKILQYFNLIASSIGNFITKALDNVIKRSKFFQFIIKRILNDTTSETEDESAAQFEAAKQQIQRQQEIRDAFLSRIQTQKDASILLKKLNGEILTDGFKLLELDNELQKNNEEKYAVLRRIQDLRGAGGRAAGFGTEINQAEAKLAELENKKIQIQIQVKEESLRVFEQQIGAAAQRSVRTLDLQTNAIQGQNTVYQSQLGLLKAGNDLYLQRLSMEEDSLNKIFEQSSNLAQQLAILDRLAEIVNIRFRLNVQNAKIERASALANLAQGNALLKIELQKQVIQYKRLVAVMKEAQAQGLLNQAHLDAVDAQYDAVVLAEQSLNYGIENAKVQAQIADSMYDQRIEAAGYARNLELAQLASRRNQLFSGGNGQLTYGQGLGQVFQLGRTYEGSSFTAMATGGFVKKPTFALIGEGGQGEYVVPESKAAAFAMNYMLGARGPGAIDSNSAPPAINISTGPVMQQNGQNYVTIQDMEAGLQAVADTILNNSRSYSARRFAGVS